MPHQQTVAEIERVARVVSLQSFLDRRVADFSGGMKRRLSLAITLLGTSELLILDEPTVGIAPELRIQIWQEVNHHRLKSMACGQTPLY